MSRDYKHRASRHHKRKKVSPLTGVIGGLLIGLFIAFLVYIKMQAQPEEQVFVKETLPTPAEDTTPQAAAGDDEPVDSAPPPPRFDFYTLLPEMEVVVPEQEITGKPQQGVRQVEKPGTYYLQVGSFRNGAQADAFKARLALLGLETSIQKVTINNGDTYHRVRVGPYSDLDALNEARRRLRQMDIDSTLVKIKG